MKIEKYTGENQKGLLLTYGLEDYIDTPKLIIQRTIELIAVEIAKDVYEKYSQEILAKIDTKAIANLVVAESAIAIRDSINEGTDRLSQRLSDLNKPVYRNGLFGKVRIR